MSKKTNHKKLWRRGKVRNLKLSKRIETKDMLINVQAGLITKMQKKIKGLEKENE